MDRAGLQRATSFPGQIELEPAGFEGVVVFLELLVWPKLREVCHAPIIMKDSPTTRHHTMEATIFRLVPAILLQSIENVCTSIKLFLRLEQN